jgi:hypothetical protein
MIMRGGGNDDDESESDDYEYDVSSSSDDAEEEITDSSDSEEESDQIATKTGRLISAITKFWYSNSTLVFIIL